MAINGKKMKKNVPEQYFYHKYQNISFLNSRFLSVGLIWGLDSFFGNRFTHFVCSAPGTDRGDNASSKEGKAPSVPCIQKGLKGAGVRRRSSMVGAKSSSLSTRTPCFPFISAGARIVAEIAQAFLPLFLPPPIIYSKINSNHREREWRRGDEERDYLYPLVGARGHGHGMRLRQRESSTNTASNRAFRRSNSAFGSPLSLFVGQNQAERGQPGWGHRRVSAGHLLGQPVPAPLRGYRLPLP